MNELYICINFPIQNIENKLNTFENLDNFLYHLNFLILRTKCEKDTNVFYSATDLENFIKLIVEINEVYEIGNYNIEDVINIIFKDLDYIEDKIINDNCLYFLWDFKNQNCSQNFPQTLKKIAKIQSQNENYKCLLLNVLDIFEFNRKQITILKDCYYSNPNYLPQLIHIEHVNNFKDLETWFQNNRIPRIFNENDNRHIESHPDYRRGKSIIIGGLSGKPILKELLKTAITFNFAELHERKDLFNFDSQNNCYVWFEFEGSNNQYHGYHLKFGTLETVNVTEAKIPIEVKDILEYRKNLHIHKYLKINI